MDIIKIVASLIFFMALPLIAYWLVDAGAKRLKKGSEHAGQLLLSLSIPIPRSRFLAVMLALILLAILPGVVIQELVPTIDWFILWTLRSIWSVLIAGGGGWAIGVFSITEIREEGIWMAGRFIPWSLIHSYQWTAHRNPKLVINLSQRIGLQNTIKLSIEPRHHHSLEEIFQQKLTTRKLSCL